MKVITLTFICLVLLAGAATAGEFRGHLDTGDLPAYLQDRGEGVSVSMFGTYIQKGHLIVYPFFEYYRDADYEYSPNELGRTEDHDYRGDYVGHEWLLFIGYGISDRLAIEMEAAGIDAELETAVEDHSGLPARISESGIGDVEGQLRWRWMKETVQRPEIFSYFETVLPTQDEGSLIGTSDWEFKLGSGVIRGFTWGTITLRLAVEYDLAEEAFGWGESALEYLRRLSPSWRVFAGVEGADDEWELITEAQWHISPNVFFKFNNAIGITSKATDWAPEIGIVFTIPTR